jgi:hypothetical protein
MPMYRGGAALCGNYEAMRNLREEVVQDELHLFPKIMF